MSATHTSFCPRTHFRPFQHSIQMEDIAVCHRVAETKICQQCSCKKLRNELKYCAVCKTRMRTKHSYWDWGKQNRLEDGKPEILLMWPTKVSGNTILSRLTSAPPKFLQWLCNNTSFKTRLMLINSFTIRGRPSFTYRHTFFRQFGIHLYI